MISIHASAVCQVRDGYTGRPLEGSALLCALDGAPCRPVAKAEGYLVLLNLSPGRHRLSLQSRGYQEEWVEFQAGGDTKELDVTMKPGPGYPFRRTVTRLILAVRAGGEPAAGRQIWLAVPGRPERKLAQTKAEAGDSQVRLYSKGSERAGVPGTFLIADGVDSEIIGLRALEGERGILTAPLNQSHSRGCLFLPAQRYHTGPDGRLAAVFREACTVEVYAQEGGLLASLSLDEGENEHTIQL